MCKRRTIWITTNKQNINSMFCDVHIFVDDIILRPYKRGVLKSILLWATVTINRWSVLRTQNPEETRQSLADRYVSGGQSKQKVCPWLFIVLNRSFVQSLTDFLLLIYIFCFSINLCIMFNIFKICFLLDNSYLYPWLRWCELELYLKLLYHFSTDT